jgi:hypothetical protein
MLISGLIRPHYAKVQLVLMDREPDNFPLYPHLRERSNKDIDRYTQRSKWVTKLLDWPNLLNDLLAAAKQAQFCLRDQVIVLFVCDTCFCQEKCGSSPK